MLFHNVRVAIVRARDAAAPATMPMLALFASVAHFGCARGEARRPEVAPQFTIVTRTFTPRWYDANSREDSGTGVSPVDRHGRLVITAQGAGATATISESLAINQARQAMALSIEGRVEVIQKNFQEQLDDAGDRRLIQRFQDANTVLANLALRGSVVKRKETYLDPEGGFRTFVMMELDERLVDASYLDLLKTAPELNARNRATEAWDELERRAKELENLTTDPPPSAPEAPPPGRTPPDSRSGSVN